MPSNMTGPESKFITALKRNVLFHALPVATLARVAADATVLNLPRGKQLPRNGGRSPGVYAVVSGCLMLSVGTPESGKVMALVSAGEHLGLASALLGTHETVNAVALADSSLLLVARAALLEFAAGTPRFALQLAMALSRQVQGFISDIEAVSLRSGHERVADYLLHLAGATEARPINGMKSHAITLPAKKSIIASRLSLTPEYFSRVLHDLIVGGAIAVNGRHITVLDSSRLYAGGD